MKVRIGFGLGTHAGLDRPQLLALVDALERLRFDSLWLSERVSAASPDPLLALAVAAGRTERLKLGTSVLVLPGRPPALVAKSIATLDVLSGGRALPAVGLGALDPVEQQAFGVRREERAAWVEEALPLLRRFWSGEAVTHAGPLFRFDGVRVAPTPVRGAGLDVWLGGRADSELRRTGRLADGWLPSFTTPQAAARGRLVVEEAAAGCGRAIDPEHFGAVVAYRYGELPERVATLLARRGEAAPEQVVPAGLTELRRRLEEFVEVGFSKFVVLPLSAPTDWPAELDRVAQALLDLQA